MIVFNRKKRDQIVIGDDIVITVMQVRGSRVSLGIKAPNGVRILRTELTPFEIAAAADASQNESADILPAIS